MAQEQILLLRLLADLKQPIDSFAQLEGRLKTLRTGLKNTPKEGTRSFEELAKQISGRTGKSIDDARKLIVKFQKDATSEIRRGTNELKEYRRTLRTIEPAANSINALRQQVRSLAQEVDNLDRNTEEFASKNKLLGRLNRELIKIEKTTARGGRNVGNYETAFRGLGRAVSGIAASFGVGFGIAGVTRLVQDGVRVFQDFNQQIATLQAISGATTEEIDRLEGQSKQLGATTQFTATQVATLQTNLARLGFSVKEIEAATGAILNLSIATGEDLATSAKTVGQTIRAYGLDASDATRVTDGLTASFNNSALQLNTYQEAYKLFAPIAKQLNISFEEATSIIGLFADQGLEGTIATTALGTAFQKLTDATSRQSKAARRLGVEVFNNNGEFVGMAQLIKNVEEATKGFNQEQRLAAINQIFGARAAKNFGALLNAQKEVVTETGTEILRGGAAIEAFTKQLEGASGEAERTAGIVGDTLNQDMLKLRSAIEAAAIEFGEMNEGGLREFIQFLTAAVPVLAENVGLILRVTAALALYAARAQTATAATFLASTAQKGFAVASSLLTGRLTLATAAQKLFNKAAAGNPVGLVVFAVTSLVFALQELYSRFTPFKEFVDETTVTVKAFFTNIYNAVTGSQALQRAFQAVVAYGRAYIGFWIGLIRGVVEFVRQSKIVEFVLGQIQLRIEIARRVFGAFVDLFQRARDRIREFIRDSEFLTGVFNRISDGASKAREFWARFVEVVGNTSAFIAGVSAEVTETLRKIENRFRVFAINTEIAFKQLEKLNPFGRTAEQIENEIKKLRAKRFLIANEGRAFGEAFTEAYNLELARINKVTIDATTTDSGQNEQTAGNTDLGEFDADATGGPDKEDLRLLEQWIKRQKELTDEIRNRIAEQRDYSAELTEFFELREKINDVEERYKKLTEETAQIAKGSTEDYKKQLKDLGEQLSKVEIGSAQYLQIEIQINQVLDERKEKLENVKASTDEYREALSDLSNELREGDAELSVTRVALFDLQNVSGNSGDIAEQTKRIEDQLRADLAEINRQRLNRRLDGIKEEIDAIDDGLMKELQNTALTEQQKTAIRRKWAKRRVDSEEELLKVQTDLLKQEYDEFKRTQDRKTKELQEQEKKRNQLRQAGFEVANELSNLLVSNLAADQEDYFNRQNQLLDREEERLLANADRVGATEEQKQEIRQRFADEREELEREQARERRRIAQIEAALNIALGVTKELSRANYVGAGLVAVLGAIQIAIIRNSRFAQGGLFDKKIASPAFPQFGRGAYLSQGRYHSQNGMPIINPITGQQVAEIEKDEGILNRRIMTSPEVFTLTGTGYEIASMLNSHRNWGVSFPRRTGSGAASKKTISQTGYRKHKYKYGGSFGISRGIPKMQRGAVFSSDISNEAGGDTEIRDEIMMSNSKLLNEVVNLRKSNEKNLQRLESTEASLKKLRQYNIDEQNAS